MLLAKRPKTPDAWRVPDTARVLIDEWFLIDGALTDFTPDQIRLYKMREITDPALQADLPWLTHDVWDGVVRRMTTGSAPLGDPLSGDDLAAWTRAYRYLAKAAAADAHSAAWSAAQQSESELERQSWPQQQAEAQALAADPTAETPLLDLLATARGISTSAYASKVRSAAAAANADLAARVADLKAAYQAIDSANSASDLKSLGWV